MLMAQKLPMLQNNNAFKDNTKKHSIKQKTKKNHE